MKRLSYFVFLFLSLGWNPVFFVDVSTYGAVGDGVTDDTSAIQSAFDSGNDISFEAGKSYRITAPLQVNAIGEQHIYGNGAKLIMTSGQLTGYSTGAMVRIEKPSGTVYFDDLDVDANRHASQAYNINSSFELLNCDVRELHTPQGSGTTACGIYVDLNKSGASSSIVFANALISHCSVEDVYSVSTDCQVAGQGAGDGNAKGIQVVVWGATINNSITIENTTINNVWGDDADGLDLMQTSNFGVYTGQNYVSDVTISNCARRGAKARMDNTTWTRVTINEPEPTNPNIQCNRSTGVPVSIIAVARNDYATGQPYLSNTFRECVFNGAYAPYYHRDFAIVWAKDVLIEGCDFNRCNIDLRYEWGNIYLIGNNFDGNSVFRDYNVQNGGWLSGTGFSDTNNTKASANWNSLTYQGTPQQSPVSCYDGIQNGTETGIDSGGICNGSTPPSENNNDKSEILIH